MEWKWTEEYYQSIERHKGPLFIGNGYETTPPMDKSHHHHCIDDQTSQRQLWTDDMEAMMMVNIMTTSAKQNCYVRYSPDDIHRTVELR